MAGTETARFDLVMQFSEEAYQEVLGVFFDNGGLLSQIVDLIPGLDGIGASGDRAHATGEFVDLESLPKITKKAALLIYRLTR